MGDLSLTPDLRGPDRALDTPELRLLAALLEDARFCLAPSSLVDRETRLGAVAWVLGEVDSPSPCSFGEVCAIFGLDEEATRERLLGLARGGRSRPLSRPHDRPRRSGAGRAA